MPINTFNVAKDDLIEGESGTLDQDCKAVQNDQMSVHSKQNWTPEFIIRTIYDPI